ncbi:MAG: ABC transporter ATP-binding protein [Firmicutes bacterium]|nr:ABC transporter ATP-binding protein [Bacillota bacterium]
MSHIVECRGLTKIFPGCKALDNVNLGIGRGKVIGLLGPNGSGKTTLIKVLNGLLQPTSGQVYIDGHLPGVYTKAQVSYLPDKTYFADWMRVRDIFDMFADFYQDFDRNRAIDMCHALGIDETAKIKTMSKGTKEKVQLILVMSRNAQLYLLDEPIAGVDPAAREYILSTIINNYNEDGTVIISTHLISDIERILDEVIFIRDGKILLHEAVDELKEKQGKSVDAVFRDSFRMTPYTGYADPGDLAAMKEARNHHNMEAAENGDMEERGGELHDR